MVSTGSVIREPVKQTVYAHCAWCSESRPKIGSPKGLTETVVGEWSCAIVLTETENRIGGKMFYSVNGTEPGSSVELSVTPTGDVVIVATGEGRKLRVSIPPEQQKQLMRAIKGCVKAVSAARS